MNRIVLQRAFYFFCTGILLIGCTKSSTNTYPDPSDPRLTIFSNTSNNILSCMVNDQPWRTQDRKIYLLSRPAYEVYIRLQKTSTAKDSLWFSWNGYYNNDINNQGNLDMILPVAKNFGYRDLSALMKQRLHLDSNNGYFLLSINGLISNTVRGSGNIYFHTMMIDSVGPNNYSGSMSGLFDADFNSVKITKGRFDHSIDKLQVSF
jgi:hypothetical protein